MDFYKLSKTVLFQGTTPEETEQMLSCLKETDQLLFRQLFVEELPVDEVAKRQGISQAAVYNRVSRGRKQLRKQYWMSGKEQS